MTVLRRLVTTIHNGVGKWAKVWRQGPTAVSQCPASATLTVSHPSSVARLPTSCQTEQQLTFAKILHVSHPNPAIAAHRPPELRVPRRFEASSARFASTDRGQIGSEASEGPAGRPTHAKSEEPDEGPAGRLLRLLLVGTIAAVALKLLPSIGHGNVIQAVRLLEAETPFMQRSGAQRVKFLASTGLADELLLTEGAPARLLALLHRDGDQGVMTSALEALDAICKKYDGRESVVLAGAVDALQKGVDEQWFAEDKAKDMAAQLLVALKIQQNHVE